MNRLYGLALVVAGALALSACVAAPQINPPVLELEEQPPSVTNIKMTNGAGETLYDGPRPSSGNITANPTPEQLDGKMTIVRTYDDGSKKEQTLTYEAGKPIKMGYSEATGEYYVDKTPPIVMPKFYGGFRPSYEFRNRDGTPIIRREDNNDNVLGIIKGDNDSSNPSFKGNIGFVLNRPFFGLAEKWGLELAGSYYNAKSTTNIPMLSNPGRLGIPAPFTGGGVAIVGGDFSNVNYKSNYWSWQIEPRLRKSYSVGELFGKPLRMNSYIGFQYGEDEDDEDLDFDVPTFPLQVRSQVKLDNWYYGPEFGFYDSWEWCPRVHLTAGAFAKLYVNNLSASRSTSLAGLVNNSEQDSLSETTVTMGGGVNLGLHYKFTNYLTARIGYEYERADNTPYLDWDQTHGGVSLKTQASDINRIYIGAKLKY